MVGPAGHYHYCHCCCCSCGALCSPYLWNFPIATIPTFRGLLSMRVLVSMLTMVLLVTMIIPIGPAAPSDQRCGVEKVRITTCHGLARKYNEREDTHSLQVRRVVDVVGPVGGVLVATVASKHANTPQVVGGGVSGKDLVARACECFPRGTLATMLRPLPSAVSGGWSSGSSSSGMVGEPR